MNQGLISVRGEQVIVPTGVDPVLMNQLAAELERVLDETPQRAAQARTTDYMVPEREDSGADALIGWEYNHIGDYDQNGEVTIGDLTPVGQHFGTTDADANWVAAVVADGDDNGEVNISDVTPIGQNFGEKCAEFVVESADSPDGPWTEVARVPLTEGWQDPAGGLLWFEATITNGATSAHYRVWGDGDTGEPPPPPPPTGNWESAGYAAGGLFTVIITDPVSPDVVYAASDVSGVYRSEDRGENWIPKSAGLDSLQIVDLVVDPSNNSRLWAATPLGLFLSENRGDNWSLVNGQIRCFKLANFQAIAVSSDGNTVLVAAHVVDDQAEYDSRAAQLDGVLYRSTNGGQDWGTVTSFPVSYPAATRFPCIAADPYEAGHFYMGASGHGVIKSIDGGATWSAFDAGLPGDLSDYGWRYFAIGQITVYVSASTRVNVSEDTPPRFYKSAKNTAAWNSIISGLPTEDTKSISQTSDCIIVSPQDENTICIGFGSWPGAFFRSMNGGGIWAGTDYVRDSTYFYDVTNNPYEVFWEIYADIIRLAVDPTERNRIYASTWTSLFRSDDGGATWYEKSKGTHNTVATDVEFAGGRYFASYMDTIVATSENPFGGWTQSLPTAAPTQFGHAWDLAVVKDTAGGTDRVFVGVSATSGPPLVYRTDDLGQTWNDKSPAFPATGDAFVDYFSEVEFAVDPNTEGVIYALSAPRISGIWRSDNYGDSWTKLASQPGDGSTTEDSNHYECIAVDPTNSQRLFAGTFWEGLYISENAGGSWTRIEASAVSGGPSIQVAQRVTILPDGTVWVAGDVGFYRSTDSGASFTFELGTEMNLAQYEHPTDIVYNPADPQEIYVSTARAFPIHYNNGSVWRTTNGGTDWEDFTGDLMFRRVWGLHYQDGYIYAATEGANVYRRATN